MGWPIGRNLGVEGDLAARFGVGRGVIRQAAMLVARSGLAESRRGRDGGLIVTAPSREAASSALHAYLGLRSADIGDILDAQHQFEDLAIRLATRQQAAQDTAAMIALREMLIDERGRGKGGRRSVTAALARSAHNPYLDLINNSLCDISWPLLTGDVAWDDRRRDQYSTLSLTLVEAVIGVDVSAALAANGAIHALFRAAIADVDRRLTFPDQSESSGGIHGVSAAKLGDVVAQDIRQRIKSGELELGDRIGSVVDIGNHYGIGRGAVRDAIRLLERAGLARAVRGKYGGLFVDQPKAETILRTAVLYLRSSGVRGRALMEVGEALDCFAAGKAALRQSTGRTFVADHAASRALPLRERSLNNYRLIGELANSPVVSLLIALQAGLVEIFPASNEEDELLRRGATDPTEGLFNAIMQGDAMLARNWMQRVRRQYRFRLPPLSTLSAPRHLGLLEVEDSAHD